MCIGCCASLSFRIGLFVLPTKGQIRMTKKVRDRFVWSGCCTTRCWKKALQNRSQRKKNRKGDPLLSQVLLYHLTPVSAPLHLHLNWFKFFLFNATKTRDKTMDHLALEKALCLKRYLCHRQQKINKWKASYKTVFYRKFSQFAHGKTC